MAHDTEGVTVTLPIEEYNKLIGYSKERKDLDSPEMRMLSALYQVALEQQEGSNKLLLFEEAARRVINSSGADVSDQAFRRMKTFRSIGHKP